MINYELQIAHLEDRLAAGSDTRTAVNLTLRYWQASCFATPNADSRTLMQRANHIALTAHRRNPSNIELYCLAVFIAIEAGHYDSANDMLDKALEYKSFLRSNEPKWHAVLCFLYAYLEINQKRVRSAKKHWRALANYIASAPPHPNHAIMQGMLHLASEEFDDAYECLRDAFRTGSNSIFMFGGLYRYYRTTPHQPESSAILAVLIYAARRGVDILRLAEYHQGALLNAVRHNPQAGEELYAVSGYPPLLQEICAHYTAIGDTGHIAYKFYKEAEHKQVFVEGLFPMLVRAAYENNAEHVSHYALTQFLESAKMDESLAIYVYHLLLTTPQLENLLPSHQANILELAAICLAKNIRSREANSLYYYFSTRSHALGISGENVSKAEAILGEELTKFEISTGTIFVPVETSQVRYIYITEPEKRGMEVYDIQEADNGKIVIEASSQDISYTCLGAGRRTVLDEKLTIRRMIPAASVELYRHFFDGGDRRFHLLTFLTNHYLAMKTLPDDAISVFQAMLEQKAIANAYKMRVLVALGRLHYNALNFEQALDCYAMVNEKELGNDFIPQILSVYMQTNEPERAARLLATKHMYITGDILLDAVITLLGKPINHSPLAEIAYNLLAGGYYNEVLLDVVLAYHHASYTELVTLAKTLDEDGVASTLLDVKIVEAAMNMANWDAYAQEAFVRMCENAEPELVQQFTEYATYELLANNARPEYALLNLLESACLQSSNTLLTWGLASCYLYHNITTQNTEAILTKAVETLEDEGILLPIFKENRPSRVPFIEKYQPFLHRGASGKDFRLNYRIDDAPAFTSMPMQYLKYSMYVACLPVFYNEEVTYYFSEEMPTGSIATKSQSVKNTTPFLHDHPTDQFFAINNALTYDQMFKHEQVEKAVAGLVKDVKAVKSKLL